MNGWTARTTRVFIFALFLFVHKYSVRIHREFQWTPWTGWTAASGESKPVQFLECLWTSVLGVQSWTVAWNSILGQSFGILLDSSFPLWLLVMSPIEHAGLGPADPAPPPTPPHRDGRPQLAQALLLAAQKAAWP